MSQQQQQTATATRLDGGRNSGSLSSQVIDLGQNVDIFNEQKKQYRCPLIRYFLQSVYYQVIITILTVFVIFADDIRVLTLNKYQDDAFDYVQLTMMGIFFAELILSSLCIPNYLFGFFFWNDLLSTASILMDVGLFTNAVFATGDADATNISVIARQSKASRISMRAIRVVKLLRLLRLVKLYKAAVKTSEIREQLKKEKKVKKIVTSTQKPKNQSMALSNDAENTVEPIVNPTSFRHKKIAVHPEQHIPEHTAAPLIQPYSSTPSSGSPPVPIKKISEEVEVEQSYKQSRVSEILSDSTIKKVMIVVLLIQLVIPLFDPSVYVEASHSMDFFISNLKTLLNDPDTNEADIIGLANEIVTQHMYFTTPLVYFSTPFRELVWIKDDIYDDLRLSDTIASTETVDGAYIMSIRQGFNNNPNTDNVTIIAVLNGQYLNNLSAYFSIATTVFICLVLGLLLHYFTKDIHDLVIEPIEGMMGKIRQIARNPGELAAFQQEKSKDTIVQQNQYQTAIVHNAIVKIGGLLSLVFGSAGAEIIGTNMMKRGDMNPLIGGKKKCAIFGFCDIRNFTDATEVLQEDIMIFVNQIGEIVHSSVYRYLGSPNKNIGDAFLLVWNIDQDKYIIDKNNKIQWINRRYVSILSDFALLSFIKIIVKINKDPKILRYSKDIRLIQRLGKNYQVKMGFGLHVGWAIEGAIGSQYKIDASYLSPNVNMAARLQAATKQYGVPILISSHLFQLFTDEMKEFCREIDRVTVKGSNQPIGFYTVDLDISNISPPADKQQKYPKAEDQPTVHMKRQVNKEIINNLSETYSAYQFIEQKKQLRQVLMVNVELHDFIAQYEIGFESYIQGDWGKALAYFELALKYKNNDGPVTTLMNYIKKNMKNGAAPSDWKHYRELTQK